MSRAGDPTTNLARAANLGVDSSAMISSAFTGPRDVAFVTGARAKVGFIYLTDDTVPNPWDTLPAYFPSLLAALE